MKKALFSIHPEFRLEGRSYDFSSLLELARAYSESGSEFKTRVGSFITEWLDERPDIAVHTSGSTGAPKQIRLRKLHMVNSARATATFFGLAAGSKALLCLSADTIAGKMMLVRAMAMGWHLDLSIPSSMPLENITKTYDFCAMVPLQLRKSLKHIHRIQTLIIGGAAMPSDLKKRVTKLPVSVYETFGMTETASHIALKQICERSNNNQMSHQDTFKTLPGVTVSTDNRGCLVIEAPDIAKDILRTNDLVDLVSPNEFRWLGRLDHIINSAGVKLIPERIEQKLASLIEGRYILTGVPDEEFGDKLVLVVESNQVRGSLRDEISKIREIHPYEVPRAIYSLKNFPETGSGKPDRRQIKNLIKDMSAIA